VTEQKRGGKNKKAVKDIKDKNKNINNNNKLYFFLLFYYFIHYNKFNNLSLPII
jgi:hypothetical protein